MEDQYGETCASCLEKYSDKNPQYEDFGICTVCASKIAVSVLATVVANSMLAFVDATANTERRKVD